MYIKFLNYEKILFTHLSFIVVIIIHLKQIQLACLLFWFVAFFTSKHR